MQFFLIAIAILLGFIFGVMMGASYMADHISVVVRNALKDGYDIGVKETKKKYNIGEEDD